MLTEFVSLQITVHGAGPIGHNVWLFAVAGLWKSYCPPWPNAI